MSERAVGVGERAVGVGERARQGTWGRGGVCTGRERAYSRSIRYGHTVWTFSWEDTLPKAMVAGTSSRPDGACARTNGHASPLAGKVPISPGP